MQKNHNFWNIDIFQLDSIKWYKDGREFYRLHPQDGQRREFHAQGVNIDANLTAVRRNNLYNTPSHNITLLSTAIMIKYPFQTDSNIALQTISFIFSLECPIFLLQL